MLKKILRKTLLLSGILLLPVFVIAQYSWGCDDKDKWDCHHHDGWDHDGHNKWSCDDHDKWSCDKHGEPCHPPKIQIVYLHYNDESIEFTIWGKNFRKGASPVVTLGGTIPLIVNEHDDDYIKATLAFQNLEGGLFVYGDYKLAVSTCNDKYCKDHCSKCKDKHCADHCRKCKDKCCKDQDPKCKCKDKYCLTIPDPSEQLVTIGSSIVEKDGEQISTNEFEGYASCDPGYTLTGGGFKSVNLKIVDSRPDGNSWYVLGRITFDKEADPTLKVYAVCIKIK